VDAPTEYKNAGIMMLISGFFNFTTAMIIVLSLIWVCIGVFWLVPAVGAAFQCWVGFQMMQGNPTSNGKVAGIVSAAINLNPLPLVLAILALMNLNKPEVAGWLEARQ